MITVGKGGAIVKTSKRNLIFSIVSLVLISSVLAVSTFERRQNGFTVFGRKFFSGSENSTFDVDLYWASDPDTEEWKSVEVTGNEIPLDGNVKWEPDHSETRFFKIKNAGDYDFNCNLGIDIPDNEIDALTYISGHPIGNVIDVYLCRNIADLNSREYVGTLSECFQIPNILNDFELASGSSSTCALVFTMKHEAGNEYQGTFDENNNRINNIGFKICAGAYAEEPDPEYDGEFGIALPNSDSYLYRVGNGDSVAASKLFYVNDAEASSSNTLNIFALTAYAADFDGSLLSFTGERIAGTQNVGLTFTPGTGATAAEVLSSGKFKFSGNGIIKVTMLYDGQPKAELNLEVVGAKNATKETGLPTGSSVVLFDDINVSSTYTLSGGRTIYGNGFCINDARSSVAGTNGYLNISNGTVDNAVLNGRVYDNLVIDGVENEGYAPGVWITGNANIYNSHISECRYAVLIEGSDKVLIKNTTLSGGAMANLGVTGGNVTLENCTTSTSVRDGLKGLGVHVATSSCTLKIEGSLKQYNWLRQSDVPSTYSSIVNSVYNDSNYAFTSGGTKYVNMGILFFTFAGSIPMADAQSALTDNTSNNYGFIEKEALNKKGTLYTAKSSEGSADMLTYPGYTPTTLGQYYTEPSFSFDYTSKNYKAKVAGDNNYCYYDSATGKVIVSFDKANSSAAFNWDPMILTAQKYGSSLDYTVTMNGTGYTGSVIPFAESGEYQVVYTCNDVNQYLYNSDDDLHTVTVPYTRVVNISVTAVEPETVTYYAEFSYVGTWVNSAKTVIGTDNKTYVMPNISATGTNFGSTTAGGQTVYYPIVSVPATGSNGNTAYSSGQGYYFAPAFNAINIKDYNQDTGATQYTYNASSTTWPHGQAQANGPDSAVFGYANGAAYNNQPYGRSMNSQYYKFGKNNNGLCYTSNEIEKDNAASNHLVQYHYVSNDGTTYYYYIRYDFGAMTYESGGCFAPGTMITLADGSRKPIEKITYDDRIMSYNFFTGKTEGKDIALLVNHGEDYYDVLNLKFSDGTVLRLIADHGVFDYTLNRYIYLTQENFTQYAGDKFVKFSDKGKIKKVKLVDAYTTKEYTVAYSITSSQNSNAFAQNMLTVAPPDKFYNWIDMGGKMRYDTKQFEADVKQYGLYDYSVFKDYVSYDVFTAFNGPYLKVAVEKGKFTFDDILKLIGLYAEYMK